MPDNIATREIRACRPGGSPFTITLRIGAPYPSGEVDWACAVGLDGLHDNLKPQHGVDSWQARASPRIWRERSCEVSWRTEVKSSVSTAPGLISISYFRRHLTNAWSGRES